MHLLTNKMVKVVEAGLQADLHRAQIRDAWLCGSPFPQRAKGQRRSLRGNHRFHGVNGVAVTVVRDRDRGPQCVAVTAFFFSTLV